MTDKLDQSSLKDVLAALKKVTKPHQLGIQLNIDSSELDTIEKNHPRDNDRQKTEVIKYWLRNSPDASWTTLASAVERMGGQARLAKGLRRRSGREETSGEDQFQHLSDQHGEVPTSEPSTTSTEGPRRTVSLPLLESVQRNILILGKREHGKSTLGNVLLNFNGRSNASNPDRAMSHTHRNSALILSQSQHKHYTLCVYDHNGLFEGLSSDDTLYSDVPDDLNLVVVVLKQGRRFDADERERLKALIAKWQIHQISAIALTHCESLSEKKRKSAIKQFKKDHPSIAKLMGKGILAVGFPDSSHIQAEPELSQRVEDDKAKLRQLIYSCDDGLLISEARARSLQGSDSDTTYQIEQFEGVGEENEDQTQTRSCCSIM